MISLLIIIFSCFSYSQETTPNTAELFNTFSKIQDLIDISVSGIHECEESINFGTLKDYDGDEFEISVIDEKDAIRIFNQFKKDKELAFKYINEGCYARATQMSFELDQKNIHVGKVFVEGSLQVAKDKKGEEIIHWVYHVAPVVFIKKGNYIDLYVIDPGLAEKPITLGQWLDKQKPKVVQPWTMPMEVYFTNRYHFLPNQKGQEVCGFDDFQMNTTSTVLKKNQELLKSSKKRFQLFKNITKEKSKGTEI